MHGDPRPELDITGRCDCGAVTLAARGRVASMFLCACENCQRATGTGHAAIVLFPAGSVTIHGALKTYSRPADSGATFTRHFCPACGTTVYAQSSRAPDLFILHVGVFAGDNDWFEPGQLIFARSHQQWDQIAGGLPRHATYRPATP